MTPAEALEAILQRLDEQEADIRIIQFLAQTVVGRMLSTIPEGSRRLAELQSEVLARLEKASIAENAPAERVRAAQHQARLFFHQVETAVQFVTSSVPDKGSSN